MSLWGHSPHTLDSAQTTGKRWIRAGLSRLAGNTPNPDQGCMTGSLPPGGHFLKGDPPKRGNPHLQSLPVGMKESPPESETRCSLFGAPARPQHLCSLGSGGLFSLCPFCFHPLSLFSTFSFLISPVKLTHLVIRERRYVFCIFLILNCCLFLM